MTTFALVNDRKRVPIAEKPPKGLYVLCVTEICKPFGFYTTNAMIALYRRDTGRSRDGMVGSARCDTGVLLPDVCLCQPARRRLDCR